MSILIFNSRELETIEFAHKTWVSAKSLANALEYANERSINKLFNSNKNEFTSGYDYRDTESVCGTNSITVKTRYFSLEGAILISMFARTEKSKEFRKWAKEVLKKELEVINNKTNITSHFSPSHTKPFKLKFNNQTILLIKNPNTDEILFNFNILCENIGLVSNNQRHKILKDNLLVNNIYKAKGRLNQISNYLPIRLVNYA